MTALYTATGGTMNAIPYHAPVTVSHGWLSSPDWWYPLAYGLVALLALCCVPGPGLE